MISTSHGALWNNYMRSYDFLQQVDGYRQNLNDIADAIDPKPGERILDAGSGTGNLSLLLKARGASVVSCDFSEAALTAHCLKDPDAVTLRTSLEEPLPFETASFDAIACASVLFTLSSSGCRLALSEFHRALKPTGQLVVTVPAQNQRNQNLIGMHFASLSKRRGCIAGFVAGVRQLPALAKVLYYNHQLAKLPDWEGFHRFNEQELGHLINDKGFRCTSTRLTYGGSFVLVTASK
jgi:ubiquinone/menaquinone biosynthesis C-methylase UbiE